MNLGIFARTFSRPTLEEALDAVVAHGLRHVQLNLACCGLPTLPDALSPAQVRQIREAFTSRGLEMSALSATFNLIHPDPEQRRQGLRRLEVLAAAAGGFGTGILTLCTGTRDPHDMWRNHADNSTAQAWEDLLVSMEEALRIAARHGVRLGVEPEVSNVVDSADRARRLLDHFRSPYLKIVMDPANLFHAGALPRMGPILRHAFAVLGPDVILAHAKDLKHDGEAGQEAAGTGVLDYDLYLALLAQSGFRGTLMLHGLREDQVSGSLAFLKAKLSHLENSAP